MKITSEQKVNIQNAFHKMNSKNEFLALLNDAKKIIYGEKFIPFEEKQLNYYINKDSFGKTNLMALANTGDDRFINRKKKSSYILFSIKKKSGGERIIHAPIKGLKEIQKTLNVLLQCIYEPHKAANGFVIGKSIVDNAKVHVSQNYVYNIDLKDFFPSVDKSRVWGRLLVTPFHLGTTPERKKIANMIASLCCTTMAVERLDENEWVKKVTSVLPQGAPTSPTITNAICEKMDIRLAGVAKRFKLNYTRYADDITFSSNHNTYITKPDKSEVIFASNSTFDMEIRRIIGEQNFYIKESKVRLQKVGYRQEVTGLIVNDKVNVTRRYIKQLRQWLYYWESYGYDKAYVYFLQKYIVDKGHTMKEKPNMMMVLAGKLLYLKMVKGSQDDTYLKLKTRFDNLMNVENSINSILDIWENQGIERAMEVYYSKKNENTSM